MAFKETLQHGKTTIFLSTGHNDWGWFIRVTEWRPERKSPFIVIPGDWDLMGWSNMAVVLTQMMSSFNNRRYIVHPIVDYYQKLFQETSKCRPLLDGLQFNKIQRERQIWLERPFDMEKVVAAFHSL